MLNEFNLDDLAKEYKKNGYVKVNDFLDSSLAKKLFKEFNGLPWRSRFITRFGEDIRPASVDQIPESCIIEDAETSFGFYYNFYEPEDTSVSEFEISDFMNSFKPRFRDFVAEVTENNRLKNTYVNLSEYKANHFNKMHDDVATTDYGDRFIVFYIPMTPVWEAH